MTGGRHCEIMWQVVSWAMEMHSPPWASDGKGMRQMLLQTDSAVFCYTYTDKTTTARPGLELDFGLNVVRNLLLLLVCVKHRNFTVRNESVTQLDWTLCSALTHPDNQFYWSTRIIATTLWLIAIVIQHSPSYMSSAQPQWRHDGHTCPSGTLVRRVGGSWWNGVAVVQPQ